MVSLFAISLKENYNCNKFLRDRIKIQKLYIKAQSFFVFFQARLLFLLASCKYFQWIKHKLKSFTQRNLTNQAQVIANI
jgi:hypothetical protein